ncbi:MAG TPA: peptidase domain-containing ABC transporter [Gammaproteobacteria bacterium]
MASSTADRAIDIQGRLALGLRRKLPVVLQSEASECGLACLSMIAGYYGRRIDLPVLRRRYSVSLKGTTLAALIDVAGRLKLATRPVRLEIEHLKHLRLPCILHWNMNHFVVLKSAGARHLRIHDPASGERKLRMSEASDAFTGVALELWPERGFAKTADDSQPVTLRKLIGRVTGLFGSLSQILLLALVLEVFTLVSPLFMQWTLDHVIVTANVDLLTTLAIGFALVLLIQQGISAVRAWVIMHFGTTLNVQWHANVFTHMLRLPLPYFEKRHLGDIVSRFRSIDSIQSTLTSASIEAVIDGIMIVFVVVLIFLYSPLLSWICLAAMAVYGLCRRLWYGPLRLAVQEQIVHAAKQESHFLETVRGVRTIKLYQNQDDRRAGWLALMVDQVNAGLRAQKLQIFYRLVNGVVFGLENIVIVWLGARMVLDGALTVGMLMAFTSYKGQFESRISALIDKYFQLKMLQIHGERLADIVLTEPERPAEDGRLVTSESEALEPRIEARGLRFRYAEHEPYVLDGVDLKIEPGESVAIVGPSGCGKTTLLHVLLGVLPPTEGEVRLGGTSLANLDPEIVRRTMASVTQNDTLFAGSIADNISFFDSRADQARIEECAKLASIHKEIVAMPMGYNTFVGYLGSVLSGGQQQRVLLARALYRRPRILVLDEATSHLDVKREIMVSSAIRGLNITRIIVAHRPQTVETADRVLTLEGGRIVDERRLSPNMTAVRTAASA